MRAAKTKQKETNKNLETAEEYKLITVSPEQHRLEEQEFDDLQK